MPFPNLSLTVKSRSVQQSTYNTETIQAIVKNTYLNSSGNVIFADVRLPNSGNDLIKVPNLTTYKLSVGDTIQLNYVNGQRHFRAITGALGAGAVNAANAQSSQNAATSTPLVLPSDISLSGVPFLLQNNDPTITGGYVEEPGSNIYFADTSPSTTSGGVQSDGYRFIAMKRLVMTSLPSVSGYPDGTLLDLVDSYGNVLGMYRLSASFMRWVLEAAPPPSIYAMTGTIGGNNIFTFPITPLGGYMIFADSVKLRKGADYTLGIDPPVAGSILTTSTPPVQWIEVFG